MQNDMEDYEALVKLFGRSGRDLKVGADGQLLYINMSKMSSLSRSMAGLLGGGSEGGGKGNKVEAEGERDIKLGAQIKQLCRENLGMKQVNFRVVVEKFRGGGCLIWL